MNKRHYEHTLPNIRGSLSNTYGHPALPSVPLGAVKKMRRMLFPAHGHSYQGNSSLTFFPDNRTSRLSYLSYCLLNSS